MRNELRVMVDTNDKISPKVTDKDGPTYQALPENQSLPHVQYTGRHDLEQDKPFTVYQHSADRARQTIGWQTYFQSPSPLSCAGGQLGTAYFAVFRASLQYSEKDCTQAARSIFC
jgi:hypothetical protein